MFHVEHSPIQPPSPFPRSALDQPVSFRIDDLNKERDGQLSQGLHLTPVQPRRIRLIPLILKSDAVIGPGRLRKQLQSMPLPR